MNWRHSKHLASGLIVLFGAFAGAAYVIASDGMTASINTPVSITGPDAICKKVTNASATGLSEYIPTATVAEWQSFVANPPAGVSLASCAIPGSQTYTTPGSYTFTVPGHNTLTVEVWGAGGGGGGDTGGTAGTAGGASRWNDGVLLANGGAGGGQSAGAFGVGGTASGGTTNTSGGNGTAANTSNCISGAGGSGANGGAGGPARRSGGFPGDPGYPGTAPGGGGGGYAPAGRTCFAYMPAGGGGGGYASRTYSAGAYSEGAQISVVVGSGGGGGFHDLPRVYSGNGAAGRVTITWN